MEYVYGASLCTYVGWLRRDDERLGRRLPVQSSWPPGGAKFDKPPRHSSFAITLFDLSCGHWGKRVNGAPLIEINCRCLGHTRAHLWVWPVRQVFCSLSKDSVLWGLASLMSFRSPSNKRRTFKTLSSRCPPDMNVIAMKEEVPIMADCVENDSNRNASQFGDVVLKKWKKKQFQIFF